MSYEKTNLTPPQIKAVLRLGAMVRCRYVNHAMQIDEPRVIGLSELGYSIYDPQGRRLAAQPTLNSLLNHYHLPHLRLEDFHVIAE